ncbi:MAG: Secretion system C-terminal sorting domain [Bacteroidota bacterium]|jgi:hypothetical protein
MKIEVFTKIYTSLLVYTLNLHCSSQVLNTDLITINQFNTNTTSNYNYHRSYIFDWNVGEFLRNDFINDSIGLTIGLLQPIIKESIINFETEWFINDNLILDSINVFPNPATTQLNIYIKTEFIKIISTELFDMYGVKIYSKMFNQSQKLISLPFQNLNKGLYLLTIKCLKETGIILYKNLKIIKL